ncbi:MAG: hypothetical protein H8D23_06480 [Candidatus Brocadiales bacterium]|nr:hypothetical protein [Candidatus Brocadiales bacterium]
MSSAMMKPEMESYQDNVSTVRYVYRNKTRCRFNISGLKNSNTFSKYLTEKFRNHEGILKAKPSTITGNILIEFNPENIRHKEIFSELKSLVNGFLETEVYSKNRKVIALYPQHKRRWISSSPTDRKSHASSTHASKCNCTLCTKTSSDGSVILPQLNKIILHVAIEAVGSMVLGGVAKRLMVGSLSRLVF